MKKMYEIEIQRSNITPKQFFTYCKAQMEKRIGIDLDNWIESYEQWSGENSIECDSTWDHDDWEVPVREICKMKSFDVQYFLEKAYNFIMEFQFDTENKGFGYMYAVEFER